MVTQIWSNNGHAFLPTCQCAIVIISCFTLSQINLSRQESDITWWVHLRKIYPWSLRGWALKSLSVKQMTANCPLPEGLFVYCLSAPILFDSDMPPKVTVICLLPSPVSLLKSEPAGLRVI